ncbi:Arm DNA-binding domain-containing protein [Rhizobium miluonense]|uniref:Arm DNA-binding domain-containing protein n=1 Tax=Rhizobium miluonense TaxID=411945 RepID=UPI001AD7E757|nr:Arm DNA-binding domain-containing protein [Rhizobium miluonense]
MTAQFVKNASTPGKYFDGHGLYLRVDDGGRRYWVQRIVIRGKRREIGLGPASLITLAEARSAAIENRNTKNYMPLNRRLLGCWSQLASPHPWLLFWALRKCKKVVGLNPIRLRFQILVSS